MDAALRRQRYLGDAVSTASPARLVTMLYDRLVRDLCAAETALTTGDPAAAAAHLVHAQDIVLALRGSLRTDAWEGAPALADLYAYLVSELIGANLAKDAARVQACRELVEPLRDAWHQAAATAGEPAVPAGV